jgi:hypothetical protein
LANSAIQLTGGKPRLAYLQFHGKAQLFRSSGGEAALVSTFGNFRWEPRQGDVSVHLLHVGLFGQQPAIVGSCPKRNPG